MKKYWVDYWQSTSNVDKAFAAGILFFLVTTAIQWNVAKYGLYFSVLIALIVLAQTRGVFSSLTKLEWALIAVLILWLLQSTASWWINDMPVHGDNHIKSRQAKLLLFIPLYLFVRQRGFSEGVLWLSLSIAVLVAGLHGFMDFANNDFQLSKEVYGGGHYAIRYGAILASLTLSLWVGVLWYSGKNLLLSACFTLISLVGVLGVLLSGTRGAWLALLMIFPMLLVVSISIKKLPKPVLTAIAVLGLLIPIGLYQVPYVHQQVNKIKTESTAYLLQGKREYTSIGMRFDLWKYGVIMGFENPAFGKGPGGFNSIMHQESESRGWTALAKNYEYPHNQYLASFSTRGLPGLLLLILLLVLPLVYFLKYLFSKDEKTICLACLGIILIMSYAIYGLTYDHLEKRVQIAFFAVNLALFMGMIQSNKQSNRLLHGSED